MLLLFSVLNWEDYSVYRVQMDEKHSGSAIGPYSRAEMNITRELALKTSVLSAEFCRCVAGQFAPSLRRITSYFGVKMC